MTTAAGSRGSSSVCLGVRPRVLPDAGPLGHTYGAGMKKRRGFDVVCLVVLAYGLFVRSRLLRWGATDQERSDPYPGRELVPDGKRIATMAVTVDAPPSRMWPWLVQMGCDRAGWYSWDHLDNRGTPSASHVHPEWQQIAVGDHFASTPSCQIWFEVAAVEPERFLALRAALQLPSGRPFDTTGDRPRFYSDSLWCFLVKEMPGRRTRMVVSGYASSRPRALTILLDVAFWEPAHWIMQTRQFANLKRRTEARQAGAPAKASFAVAPRPVTNGMTPTAQSG